MASRSLPWFISGFPADQTDVASEAHGPVVTWCIGLVIESSLRHGFRQGPPKKMNMLYKPLHTTSQPQAWSVNAKPHFDVQSTPHLTVSMTRMYITFTAY